jgi:hypothetical protein
MGRMRSLRSSARSNESTEAAVAIQQIGDVPEIGLPPSDRASLDQDILPRLQ